MTAPDPLLVEYPSDDIVVFRLNRPEVRNALNLPLRMRLADEVARHAADGKIRCLVVTGSDKVFASGADIGEMAEAGPIEVMARNVQKILAHDHGMSEAADCRDRGLRAWRRA